MTRAQAKAVQGITDSNSKYLEQYRASAHRWIGAFVQEQKEAIEQTPLVDISKPAGRAEEKGGTISAPSAR